MSGLTPHTNLNTPICGTTTTSHGPAMAPAVNTTAPVPMTGGSFNQGSFAVSQPYQQSFEQMSTQGDNSSAPPGPPLPGGPPPYRQPYPEPGPYPEPYFRPEPHQQPSPQPGPYQQPPSQQSYSSADTSRGLIDLVKMYKGEGQYKFGGEKYDFLDDKLKVFRELCHKAGVGPDRYHEAYSTMLKGRAQRYYFDYLAEKGLDFHEMVNRTKSFFHTSEDKHRYLNEWNATTIHSVIAENPTEDLPTCVDILIEQIQRVYRPLSDTFLMGTRLDWRLIEAVQGHPAFGMISPRQDDTFEIACLALRTAAGIAHQFDQNHASNNHNSTDPTYHNNANRGRFRSRGGGRAGRGFNSQGNEGKKCFVCKEPGCWSTKHPIGDRKDKKASWRRNARKMGHDDTDNGFEAFLFDYEGIEADYEV